jgi:hypothetical protein
LSFKTNWIAGETGHATEHNLIGARFNQSPCVSDFASIQAALDSMTAGGVLYFPAGDYPISETLDLTNKSGVMLIGAGYGGHQVTATKLRWTGAAGGTLLDMSGARHNTIRGIGFHADNNGQYTNSTQKAITCYGAYSGFNQSFDNLIEGCCFENFGVGVTLGNHPADNVDSFDLRHCWFMYGNTGTGLKIVGVNSVIVNATACRFVSNNYAYDSARGIHLLNGQCNLFGCFTQGNSYGVYVDGDGLYSTINITAHHSEGDGWPIYVSATSLNPTVVNRYSMLINGLFNYESINGLFHFGSHQWLYEARGVISDSTHNQDIVIAAGRAGALSLWNCSQLQGVSVKDTLGEAAAVRGRYGDMAGLIDS